MPISVSLFSEGHSPWCSTIAGTVDSTNSSGALLVSTRLAQKDVRMKELMAGVQIRQWESLNKGEERQKCHVSTESMFKEGRRTGWHFLFHQYSCILQVWVQLFYLTDWGPSLAVIKTDCKYFVKNDENKVFPQKWPAYIWPGVYSLSSGSTTTKPKPLTLFCTFMIFFTPHIVQKTFQVWQANNINSPWYRLGTNVFTVLAQCWCKKLHFKSYRSIFFMFFSVWPPSCI